MLQHSVRLEASHATSSHRSTGRVQGLGPGPRAPDHDHDLDNDLDHDLDHDKKHLLERRLRGKTFFGYCRDFRRRLLWREGPSDPTQGNRQYNRQSNRQFNKQYNRQYNRQFNYKKSGFPRYPFYTYFDLFEIVLKTGLMPY